MAYTPINWQNGDTITAAKLNRCDNGWAVESTQLFSETVTTVAGDRGNSAALAYSTLIDAPTITVTFDGTDYVCDVNDFMFKYYGAIPIGPDFTEYPFYIESTGQANTLVTQTAGAHTIAVTVPTLEVSSDFSDAVSAAIISPLSPFVEGTTTWAQVVDAMAAGRLVLRTWAEAYDGDVATDTQYAGTELVTAAYIDSHGDYRVSAITTEKGVQSIVTFSATTANEALTAS